MRSFRFPKFTILLMVACFMTITTAISLAAEISRNVGLPYFASPSSLLVLWSKQLPAMFVTSFAVSGAFGAIGYGVLVILRRTGLERLARLDAHHRARN
jgi:hypothetical protein